MYTCDRIIPYAKVTLVSQWWVIVMEFRIRNVYIHYIHLRKWAAIRRSSLRFPYFDSSLIFYLFTQTTSDSRHHTDTHIEHDVYITMCDIIFTWYIGFYLIYYFYLDILVFTWYIGFYLIYWFLPDILVYTWYTIRSDII